MQTRTTDKPFNITKKQVYEASASCGASNLRHCTASSTIARILKLPLAHRIATLDQPHPNLELRFLAAHVLRNDNGCFAVWRLPDEQTSANGISWFNRSRPSVCRRRPARFPPKHRGVHM